MKEFMRQLGIEDYTEKDGKLVADLQSSDQWGVVMSKLDNSHAVTLDEETVQNTNESSVRRYTSVRFIATLMADLEADTYKLVLETRNPEI